MPYQMVHMCIARKVLEQNQITIKDLPQYYLGSLAPDAVHFRMDFKPDDKKVSHLCVGDERWGETSNNEVWTDNVLQFLNTHKDSKNIDFIYGYCTHVLADIQNNIDIWSPFKLKHFHSLKIPDYGNGYDSEAVKLFHADTSFADKMLYLSSHFRDEIWNSLSESKGITLDGIVHEDEVNKIRYHILYRQYKDISIDSAHVGKISTYEDYLSFMDKTSNMISALLF